MSEPLYASWQTRVLLAGDDAREQVERRLVEEAPAGAWLLHIRPFIGKSGLCILVWRTRMSATSCLVIRTRTLSTSMRCSASVRVCLHYMLLYRQKGLKRSGLVAEAKVGGHAYVL